MSIKVLFVCLGNICRSPTAHGVFQQMVDDANLNQHIVVDSAGTSDWHIGKAPDPRTTACALTRGYDLSGLRARQVSVQDFSVYDFILAMDSDNLANLQQLCPADYSGRLDLFLSFAEAAPVTEVPDPYYGGKQGFEQVLDLVESASKGLLQHIRKCHLAADR